MCVSSGYVRIIMYYFVSYRSYFSKRVEYDNHNELYSRLNVFLLLFEEVDIKEIP
jgi:hypothetical protein